MKWITFIALLFLFSSASSRGLFRRDTAHKSEIAHRYNDLGEDIFKGLWLISLAQHLQKCPYEDHIQTVKEVAEFAKTCVADESAADCDHSIHAIFGDKVCARIKAHPDLYVDLTECCEKQEPERNECFQKHKDDNPDLPPLVRPAADALCASFHENEKNLLGHYLYEVARRHPYFYAPELIYYSHEYKDVLKECCEAADKDACLTPKLDALKEKALTSAAKQRIKCTNIHKFGERAFKAWAVGHISQKFPKADFTEVTKIVTGLSKIYTECCHGDLLECADDRAELAKHICDHQGELSSKLKTCCDKPVLEKSHCIVELEKDEPPADLHPLAETFVDDNEVCKHYQEAKDAFLGSFLHEYARRHLDYSVIMLLRAAKDYEGTLERCCATDDPHACYAKVLDEIQHLTDEPHNVVQTNCEKFEKLGEYDFTNSLLVRYTRKTPQVSTPTLVQVARKMGKVGNKCCKLADPQNVACAEDYLALVLNRLCLLHEKTPVSDRITKCCTESLVNRRPCFTALEPDDTYVPKPFSAETFTFHADLCTLPDDQKQTKKQTVLVELLKHKPKATDEQLKKVIGLFKAVVEKCCAAEDKEACFAVEGPKLVTESEAALS